MEYSPNLTARYLAGKIDEYVKFQGRDTLTSNAARDDRARWARIPDGKACDFCNMLGSRGFVYRSAEKAGEHNDYHPHCNCQVAVCFEPDMDYYTKNGVRVPRGYDPDDPEHAMLIDDLYAEYVAAGKRYTSSSTYRVYYNTMTTEQFDAAMRRLSEARTLDELHKVSREIVDTWPGGAANADKAQWDELSRHAKELEREFKADSLTRIVANPSGARIPAPEELASSIMEDIQRNGFDIEVGTDRALYLIAMAESEAVTLSSFRLVCFQNPPTLSELLEEQFHVAQIIRNDYQEVDDLILQSYLREIDAQRYLIDAESLYDIPENEARQTRAALDDWIRKANRHRGQNTNES